MGETEVIAGILAINLLLTVVVFVHLQRTKVRISQLLKYGDSGDLEQKFEKILSDNNSITKKQTEIDALYSHIRSISERSLQKTSLIRFNPFKDTGGDQSFALCMLDHTNSGIIITAIHSRETTRVYTKKIKDGQSALTLSNEEQQALTKIV